MQLKTFNHRAYSTSLGHYECMPEDRVEYTPTLAYEVNIQSAARVTKR